MSANHQHHAEELREESIAELVKRLAAETNTLVQQEIALAKAELAQKAKVAGRGAGMLGGAGVAGLLALGALTACVIALLATAIDHVWLSALIVAVVWALAAGVLALRGRDELREAAPPAPQQTIESVKEDVAWAKTRTRSATR
jgi:uncharacterized membrane protein YqjE